MLRFDNFGHCFKSIAKALSVVMKMLRNLHEKPGDENESCPTLKPNNTIQ